MHLVILGWQVIPCYMQWTFQVVIAQYIQHKGMELGSYWVGPYLGDQSRCLICTSLQRGGYLVVFLQHCCMGGHTRCMPWCEYWAIQGKWIADSSAGGYSCPVFAPHQLYIKYIVTYMDSYRAAAIILIAPNLTLIAWATIIQNPYQDSYSTSV